MYRNMCVVTCAKHSNCYLTYRPDGVTFSCIKRLSDAHCFYLSIESHFVGVHGPYELHRKEKQIECTA